MVQKSGRLSVRYAERLEFSGWQDAGVLIGRSSVVKSGPVQPLFAVPDESPCPGTMAPFAQHMGFQNLEFNPHSPLKGS